MYFIFVYHVFCQKSKGSGQGAICTSVEVEGVRTAHCLGDVASTTVQGTIGTTTLNINENVYGPFEAGFSIDVQGNILRSITGNGCATNIEGGIDTHTAEQILAFDCNVSLPRFDVEGNRYSLLDACGGHTQEYHFHERLKCLYDSDNSSHHSPRVATYSSGDYSIDLYGKWEGNNTLPELDYCGGHFGPVPDGSGTKYHNHIQIVPPFTFGCYGPAIINNTPSLVTREQCHAVYPDTCGDDTVTLDLPDGKVSYDLWCPCFDLNGSNTGSASRITDYNTPSSSPILSSTAPSIPSQLLLPPPNPPLLTCDCSCYLGATVGCPGPYQPFGCGQTSERACFSATRYVYVGKCCLSLPPQLPPPRPPPPLSLLQSPDISKPKILCLHGGGQSKNEFEVSKSMEDLEIALQDYYEFVYAQTPESGNVWIRDPPGGKDNPTTDINWAQNSVQYLDAFTVENGPFHAILGYSQGAAMTLVYLSQSNANSIQFVAFFNGYIPTSHSGLTSKINSEKPFNDILSIHFTSTLDPFQPLSYSAMELFTSPTIFVSDISGHSMPLQSDTVFEGLINTFIIYSSFFQSSDLSPSPLPSPPPSPSPSPLPSHSSPLPSPSPPPLPSPSPLPSYSSPLPSPSPPASPSPFPPPSHSPPLPETAPLSLSASPFLVQFTQKEIRDWYQKNDCCSNQYCNLVLQINGTEYLLK